MTDIYHVNFHTFQRQPVFLDDTRATAISEIMLGIVEKHGIVCLASTVMPTHVHAIIVTFPDQSRSRAVQFLKGASSRAFFERYPVLHSELGGRLWREGYDWVLITSHQQLQATVGYVAANRAKVGLGPISGVSDASV